MDDNISKYNGEIDISHVILDHGKNIKLLRGFEIVPDIDKRYMRNVVIMVSDEFVTSNLTDSIRLREELILFTSGDLQNKFLYPTTRKIKKETVHSLVLTLPSKKEVFIGRAEARTMVTIWNMAMQGYSFSRLSEFETSQSLETWTRALERNGYLEIDSMEY